MKIVSIFEDYLFSFCYGNGTINEYDRLMELWTDVDYLKNFAIKNHIHSIKEFVLERLEEADELQDILYQIEQKTQRLESYFMPLHNHEIGFKILSLQKGKIPKNKLRIYAVKIDEHCFVITGGAIKMSQKMDDHEETKNELIKLNFAQQYLKANDVYDSGSFFELLTEEND
ncbi:hypothetical protein [Pedobacter arcticus]|uniref:hypothetical protein n=1 Tax=Pedobacter arcticus TaxID=752140 RepID=UPI0002E722A8|nr:hypothetical protein [Pedobacter arcticus]